MRRAWVRETAGWAAALGISLAVAAQVAASARSELLFRDGDSLVVAMFVRSVLSGQPLDWAMSSVLFVPESVVLGGIDALTGADLGTLLAVNAVVNLLAVYGALRMAAGRRSDGAAPAGWALVGLAVFGLISVTETSASRDALELASLQLTTTYYSATVVGVIVAIGLVRRALDRTDLRIGYGPVLGLIAVAAISTLSNPLFGVWATVPLGLLLAVTSFRAERRTQTLVLLSALVGGTALGAVARIPFAAWIANTGAGYAQPDRWAASLQYYGELLTDRLSTPLGILGTSITVALLALATVRTVRAATRGARFVAASAWVLPLLVVFGAIALGTHAARYLQPVVFAPVLALVAAPRALRLPRAVLRTATAVVAVVLLVGGALGIPRLAAAAHRPDADLTCVTEWVDSSGRTGAGQFWTVRLPKAHLADPSQLVQVDHQLNGYAWLVNRTDLDVGSVSFLLEDAQTVPWQLPVSAVPDEVIECGRYRILDFGAQRLPLGPAHS
ncbi:MAG: hypothetical protein J7484_13055 [Microbacterium sp.]|nr:hypothetical protein [Microbacterium sp.]